MSHGWSEGPRMAAPRSGGLDAGASPDSVHICVRVCQEGAGQQRVMPGVPIPSLSVLRQPYMSLAYHKSLLQEFEKSM